jgi:hypothetical protein
VRRKDFKVRLSSSGIIVLLGWLLWSHPNLHPTFPRRNLNYGAGFTDDGFATPVNLFGKNDGGGENGLGLTNDPTGANEISGTSFIRISFPSFIPSGRGIPATASFRMGSTTEGESWLVLGSTSPTTGYVLLSVGQTAEHRVDAGRAVGVSAFVQKAATGKLR